MEPTEFIQVETPLSLRRACLVTERIFDARTAAAFATAWAHMVQKLVYSDLISSVEILTQPALLGEVVRISTTGGFRLSWRKTAVASRDDHAQLRIWADHNTPPLVKLAPLAVALSYVPNSPVRFDDREPLPPYKAIRILADLWESQGLR